MASWRRARLTEGQAATRIADGLTARAADRPPLDYVITPGLLPESGFSVAPTRLRLHIDDDTFGATVVGDATQVFVRGIAGKVPT